jgi:hypothetical protein
MRLASFKRCVVPLEKLRDYLLNLNHPDGRHKARFFSRFGYSTANIEVCAQALTDHAEDNEVANTILSQFGMTYIVERHFRTPDGRGPCIVTIWIGEFNGIARFVTAYPK